MQPDMTVKITVISVVYNSCHSLNETMLSILGQTYDGVEYIVIDGGSDDGSVEIIKQYAENIKYWCTEKDNGIYDAMNKGLSHASGDFVIFINSGDMLCSPNSISDFVNKVTDLNSVYYGNALYVNKLSKNITWRGGFFSKYRLSKTNICHQTIFYPKNTYASYRYNPEYTLFADWAYNMQIYSLLNFIYIDQDISYYDDMGVSALNNDEEFKKEQLSLVRKYLGLDCIIYLIYNKILRIVSNTFSKLKFSCYNLSLT